MCARCTHRNKHLNRIKRCHHIARKSRRVVWKIQTRMQSRTTMEMVRNVSLAIVLHRESAMWTLRRDCIMLANPSDDMLHGRGRGTDGGSCGRLSQMLNERRTEWAAYPTPALYLMLVVSTSSDLVAAHRSCLVRKERTDPPLASVPRGRRGRSNFIRLSAWRCLYVLKCSDAIRLQVVLKQA